MSRNVKQSKSAATSVAVITGGSAGLGRALTLALAERGWVVITDARHSEALQATTKVDPDRIQGIVGDVTDPAHRQELAGVVAAHGRLDLLVHNASALGPVPLRPLAEITAQDLQSVWTTNVAAPMELTKLLLPPLLAAGGVLLSVSSDAALEHYEGWGAYGAGKAALDHLTLTFGTENPVAAYAVDPGDMRTRMHQDAFTGEDISDRPLPEAVVPHLLALLATRPPSGRYRAAQFGASGSASGEADR